MKNTRLVLALIVLLCVSACGGDGSNDSLSVAGTWSGTLYLSSNTCGVDVEDQDTANVVNQDGDRVVITSEPFGNVYEGSITSESSLTATREETFECYDRAGEVIPGSSVGTQKTVEWLDVGSDSANVTYTYDEGPCSVSTGASSSGCQIIWQGQFTRQQ